MEYIELVIINDEYNSRNKNLMVKWQYIFYNSQVSGQLAIPGWREVLGEVEEDEPQRDELQEVGEDGDGREGLELLDGAEDEDGGEDDGLCVWVIRMRVTRSSHV